MRQAQHNRVENVPREVRRALKIEVGEKVIWTLEEDRACLRKVSE